MQKLTPTAQTPGGPADAATEAAPAPAPARPAKKPAGSGARAASKTAQVIEMLRRPGGATLEEVMARFGWQIRRCPGRVDFRRFPSCSAWGAKIPCRITSKGHLSAALGMDKHFSEVLYLIIGRSPNRSIWLRGGSAFPAFASQQFMLISTCQYEVLPTRRRLSEPFLLRGARCRRHQGQFDEHLVPGWQGR